MVLAVTARFMLRCLGLQRSAAQRRVGAEPPQDLGNLLDELSALQHVRAPPARLRALPRACWFATDFLHRSSRR